LEAEEKRKFKGKGKFVFDLYKQILMAAKSDRHVLITGEPGTGKELVAQEINEYSGRKPMISINIGALTGDVVNSELFGHEKGAFTGAATKRKGTFERAEGGT
jgi:DNA-binding NtrC family response regulator